jgi:hypothetical protein
MSLVIALAAATANPAPYPTVAVLDAVAGVCSKLSDRTETETRLAALGWTPVTLDPASPLGALLEMGKAEGAKMLAEDGGTMQPSAAYQKTVAGENLAIILSGVSMEGMTVNGCRLYDVDETRPMAVDDVAKWIKRKPERAESSAVLSIATWPGGFAQGQSTLDVYFVPANSPLVQALKVSGVALRVDQISFAK